MILLHLWQFSKSCVSKLKAMNHFTVLIQWLRLVRQRFQLFLFQILFVIFDEILKDWKYETIYKSHSWENENE